MPIPRLKSRSGPPILSYGFRPFFLLGGLYAGVSIALWLCQFYGGLTLSTTFAPVDWHIHEMVFGYLGAVVTGFLLTSIPNWTGRLPVQGLPLLSLVVLWLAGRLAVTWSAAIGWLPAMVIDCAFLAAVFLAAANEIASGRNWRNLKVLGGLGMLLAANVLFHLEAHFSGITDYSRRLGIAGAIVLIMLIGGRIIPSFTRNWLARAKPGRLPTPFGRTDLGIVGGSAAALLLWVAFPFQLITGIALLCAALGQIWRLSRWAGDRAIGNLLVAILHVGYLFVPLGFALSGLTALLPSMVPPAAGLHAFGAGAIGVMTMAVMVRATLGHTGHALEAGRPGAFIFAMIAAAALARIAAALDPGDAEVIMIASGVLWAAGGLGFAILFGPMLVRKRGA
jgi:uncharacterized protein involved in response to NO